MATQNTRKMKIKVSERQIARAADLKNIVLLEHGARIRMMVKGNRIDEFLKGDSTDQEFVEQVRSRRDQLKAATDPQRGGMTARELEYSDRALNTLEDLARDFIESPEIQSQQPEEQAKTKNVLWHYWLPYIGKRTPNNLSVALLDEIMEEHWPSNPYNRKKGQQKSHKTKKNYMNKLSALLNFSKVKHNIARHFPWVRRSYEEKVAENWCVNVLKPSERDLVLKHATGNLKMIVALISYAGLRPGEAYGLEWDALNLDRKKMHIKQTSVANGRRLRSSTKTGSRRWVEIEKPLKKILKAHKKAQQGPGVFLLETENGGWYRSQKELNAAYKALLAEHGIDAEGTRTLRLLRHTRASELFSQGEPHDWIARQLGHSEEVLRTNYAQWVEEYSENRR